MESELVGQGMVRLSSQGKVEIQSMGTISFVPILFFLFHFVLDFVGLDCII